MVNTQKTIASTGLDNSHDEEPLRQNSFRQRNMLLQISSTLYSSSWRSLNYNHQNSGLTLLMGTSFSLTSKALSPQAQVWASVLQSVREAGRRKGGPALNSGLSYVSQHNKRKSLFCVLGQLPKSFLGRFLINVTT